MIKIIERSDTEAKLDMGETIVCFHATEGEKVLSATLVDGCFLIGTDRRVAEWSTERGWRTLAHVEDIDGY